MSILKNLFIALFLLSLTIHGQNKKGKKILRDAQRAKKVFLKSDMRLEEHFDNSAGYLIFPNVGKGGFIIGGASGKGVVYEKAKAVGMADLKKLTVGLQFGGQALVEVICFEEREHLKAFKNDEFQFSAGVSAIALKSGVAADAKYKDGVMVFILPKAGMMVDASVGGQKFEYTGFH